MKKVQKKKLDFYDIKALNQRLAMEFLTSSALDTVIIVQKNKIYYFINCLQIKKFVYINNRDIFIFPEKHYQTKKDSSNIIQYKLLF